MDLCFVLSNRSRQLGSAPGLFAERNHSQKGQYEKPGGPDRARGATRRAGEEDDGRRGGGWAGGVSCPFRVPSLERTDERTGRHLPMPPSQHLSKAAVHLVHPNPPAP